MDTSVNAANQVVSVGADIAFDADPKFFACLVRFESSSVPNTLPTAYDVYPLDGRHDGGYYTVKDCVTIDVLPRTPGNNVYVGFFFSSRRRHTRCRRDWSSDVCSSDLHEADYEHDLSYLQKRFEITMAVCSGRSRNSGHVGGPVLCDGPHSCDRSAAKYIQPAAIRCAPGKRSSHCYGGAPGRNPWRPARLAGASPEPTRSTAGQGALCLVAGAWTNFAHRHDGRIAERISRRPEPDRCGIAQRSGSGRREIRSAILPSCR